MGLIGITGSIGVGKSAALRCCAESGFRVMDADELVHECYQKDSPVYEDIVRRYGEEVVDQNGNLSRKALGRIVFENQEELDWLEELVHPVVRQRMLQTASAVNSLVFSAVPLLFESGWHKDMNAVIAVWCDRHTRDGRLQQTGWSLEQIRERERRHLSMDKKAELADFVMVNTGNYRMLEGQCALCINRLVE